MLLMVGETEEHHMEMELSNCLQIGRGTTREVEFGNYHSSERFARGFISPPSTLNEWRFILRDYSQWMITDLH